ncbi:uncharacterized protein LOC142543302 isoform X2 [Primulina tabacum]|uniref:uncharacterized protein LOC142543302 isoform X2 n=1 Tax=Primulina tabacum TaxID=48773 RepID=UPI003F59A5C2
MGLVLISPTKSGPPNRLTRVHRRRPLQSRSFFAQIPSRLRQTLRRVVLQSNEEVMAIQGDTSADRKKSIDATDELATINLENMQNNTRVINYCRTFMSIIGGVIAGILGFTGLTGFILYFIVMAITSAGLVAKAEFSVHSYFDSWNKITLDGFLAGLMSFVLFWTFAYDFVHIF